MLQKGISEKFNDALLLEKKDIYSILNIEDIADADYKHMREFEKTLEQKA